MENKTELIEKIANEIVRASKYAHENPGKFATAKFDPETNEVQMIVSAERHIDGKFELTYVLDEFAEAFGFGVESEDFARRLAKSWVERTCNVF